MGYISIRKSDGTYERMFPDVPGNQYESDLQMADPENWQSIADATRPPRIRRYLNDNACNLVVSKEDGEEHFR